MRISNFTRSTTPLLQAHLKNNKYSVSSSEKISEFGVKSSVYLAASATGGVIGKVLGRTIYPTTKNKNSSLCSEITEGAIGGILIIPRIITAIGLEIYEQLSNKK